MNFQAISNNAAAKTWKLLIAKNIKINANETERVKSPKRAHTQIVHSSSYATMLRVFHVERREIFYDRSLYIEFQQ